MFSSYEEVENEKRPMMHEVHPSVLDSATCFLWSCKNSLMIPCCSQRKFYSNPSFLSARSCLFTDLLCCYTNVCDVDWWRAQTQCRHQNYIFLGEILLLLSKVSLYFVVWEIKCSVFLSQKYWFYFPSNPLLKINHFREDVLLILTYAFIVLCFLYCFTDI